MKYGDFSTLLCVYKKDNPVYFRIAMQSIVEQTLLPKEIVLVVDGPIPDSLNDVIVYFEKYLITLNIAFKVIRLETNVGQGNARRICMANCSYPLFAIMDADDFSLSTRFEEEYNYLLVNQDISVVGSYIQEFKTNCDPSDFSDKAGMRIVPESSNEIIKYCKKRCPMNHVTIMARKSDVESVGGYLDWYNEEDYYLWVRLIQAGFKLANIPSILVNVRIDDMYHRRGGYKYFYSERAFHTFMYVSGMISFWQLLHNLLLRFIAQVLIPDALRGLVFRFFARR